MAEDNNAQPVQDWRPTSVAGVRAWLLHLAAKVDADGWTGREDWNDPHLPAVLSLTDADGTIEVHIRPTALYEPTL